jgi:predicted nucleotidyltransferase component of viral defense system
MLYFVERLLYRLSVSAYSERFVLKGGLLLYLIMEEKARATKDIDLLAKGTANDLNALKDIFAEIAAVPSDDAVIYETGSITAERIKEDADYEGVRIKLTARLGSIRKVLQFDIGFGDAVVPAPQTMEYPTLLNMDKPVIKAYSKESVIAEKIEAMLYLAELNSRMKDFYDIYSLCANFDFDGQVLYEAIFQTVTRRSTPLSNEPSVFSYPFALSKDKQTQWNAFKRRTDIKMPQDFAGVVNMLGVFLKPVYDCILDKKAFTGHWNKNTLIWEQSKITRKC